MHATSENYIVCSLESLSFVPFRLGLLLPLLQRLRLLCGFRWAQSVATLDSINPISAVPPALHRPSSLKGNERSGGGGRESGLFDH